jgi:dUTP pyrophosphatase
MATLKIFKTHEMVKIPAFATEQAACFDISYQPWGKMNYSGFSAVNAPFLREFPQSGVIKMMPGDRVLVPTGLIFDIPPGFSIRIHPRSGLSYKLGLTLFNSEGVIDSDYYHETMITMLNNSSIPNEISIGERLAQAEMVKLEKYKIEETTVKPEQTTDRVGGFGSTGTK